LGEIALYCFLVLVVTGTYLTFFFTPSSREVVYHGSYSALEGVRMSEAYRSTIELSFDVRAGLGIGADGIALGDGVVVTPLRVGDVQPGGHDGRHGVVLGQAPDVGHGDLGGAAADGQRHGAAGLDLGLGGGVSQPALRLAQDDPRRHLVRRQVARAPRRQLLNGHCSTRRRHDRRGHLLLGEIGRDAHHDCKLDARVHEQHVLDLLRRDVLAAAADAVAAPADEVEVPVRVATSKVARVEPQVTSRLERRRRHAVVAVRHQ